MICLQKNTIAALLAAVLFAGTTACAAELTDRGNPVAGKVESGMCQGCHGAEGTSFVELIPNLAGQSALYTAKQLRDYQSGARTHQIMSAISKNISGSELADISAYFAGLKKMQGDGSGNNPLAAKLFREGDPIRGIPSCAGCHGEKGKTPAIASYPVIGGQHREYLRVQLLRFRSGDRSNSPGGVMNKAAKALADAEIGPLSDYISGL